MPRPWVVAVTLLASGFAASRDDAKMKFADCPPAVRKAFQAEAKDAKIEDVTKEKGDETIYWADVAVRGKTYSIGILEDGTLSEMNLAIEDKELALDDCPPAVREAFKAESFGEKVEGVGKDRKYGMTIYEAVVEHKGKSYQLVIAEDGTLVEKVLVIDDEEVELAKCPAPVQAAFHDQAKGGKVHEVTRSSGLGKPTYEAEVEVKGKVYLIEVAEDGSLIAKSLEATAE